MNGMIWRSGVLGLVVLLVSCGREEAVSLPEVKDGMVTLEGGIFTMGSKGYFETTYGVKEFPEETPERRVRLDGFWIDETEVTNARFAEFVEATGYVTFAEREAKLEDFPEEAWPMLPQPPFRQGSVVFRKPDGFEGDPNAPGAEVSWWRWDPDANWRQPEGEGSSIAGREDHPVVCVSHEDAAASVGSRLPAHAA